MKVEIEKEISQPFVLTIDNIKHIHNRLKKTNPDIEYRAVCADGNVRVFKSINELINFKNNKEKEIISLGINHWRYELSDSTKNATIFLHLSSRYYAKILMKLKGEEGNITTIENFLIEYISTLKPWYWFLAVMGWKHFLVTRLVFLPLWIPLYIVLMTKYPINYDSAISILIGLILIFTIATIIDLFMMFVLRKFFPTGVFRVGDGIRRDNHKEIWRQVIIVAFFIGFIVNLITAFLFS